MPSTPMPFEYLNIDTVIPLLDSNINKSRTGVFINWILLVLMAAALFSTCIYELFVSKTSTSADSKRPASAVAALPKVLPLPKAKGWHSPLPVLFNSKTPAMMTPHQIARLKAYGLDRGKTEIYSLKELALEYKIDQLIEAELLLFRQSETYNNK